MDNLKKLALRAVTLVALGSCVALAQAQAPAQAPPPAGEPYQHIPLPAQLPRGVSVKDAQHLQALIDDYNLQELLVTTKVKDNVYMVRGGPGRNVPNAGFIVGKTGVIIVGNKNSKEAEEAVLGEIAKVTPKPVKTVIILHSEHESGVGVSSGGFDDHRPRECQKGDGDFHGAR